MSEMSEIKEKIVEKMKNGLAGFAIEAGSAAIVVTICWSIVKIVQMLFVSVPV